MTKKPFVTKEKLEEIAAAVPTPFHIYDEKGTRGVFCCKVSLN